MASAKASDARAIPYADASADAALLFVPLYHLTESDERMRALREARRVLRPGGIVLTQYISRFASTINEITGGLVADPTFRPIYDRDVTDG